MKLCFLSTEIEEAFGRFSLVVFTGRPVPSAAFIS